MRSFDLIRELVDGCIDEDGTQACLLCGSHHDKDDPENDHDPSCAVSKALVWLRGWACPSTDSNGVPCELRRGHKEKCACPEALARFEACHGLAGVGGK